MSEIGDFHSVDKSEINRMIFGHEIYLSFRDDVHAQVFKDWLYEEGWSFFKKYYPTHPDAE